MERSECILYINETEGVGRYPMMDFRDAIVKLGLTKKWIRWKREGNVNVLTIIIEVLVDQG